MCRLIFLVALLQFSFSIAQPDPNKVMPPSPTAAALGKYGGVPVNLHTGTPKISIPLGVIEGTELELPISLSYMATGVKVEDHASWVGTGWSLNCTGVITHQVRGLEDLGIKPRPRFPLTSSMDSLKLILQGIQESSIDPEPDLFFYNYPGGGGSFVLDDRGDVTMADVKDIRIERNGSGSSSFTITSENGTRYIFDRGETSDYMGNSTSSSTSGIYLSKIISPTGKETISFNYATEVTRYYSLSRPVRRIRPDNIAEDAFRPTYSIHTITGLRLKSITTNFGYRVDFVPDTDQRGDLGTIGSPEVAPRALKAMRFLNGSEKVLRQIVFDYETVATALPYQQLEGFDPPADASTGYANFRLYLKGVREQSADGQVEIPPHRFTYNGRDGHGRDLLPSKLSASQDHWGFYNGSVNSSLWPGYDGPFGMYDSAFNLATACLDQFTLSSRPHFVMRGANREPRYPESNYGALESITYPTGGKTTFGFEPHKYVYETHRGGYITRLEDRVLQVHVSGSDSELESAAVDPAAMAVARFSFEFNVGCKEGSSPGTAPCGLPNSIVDFEKYGENSVALFDAVGKEIIAAKWIAGDGGFRIYRGGFVDQLIGILRPDNTGVITADIPDVYLGKRQDYTLKATRDIQSNGDVFGWLYYKMEVAVPEDDEVNARMAGGIRIKSIQDWDERGKLAGSRSYSYGAGVLMEAPKYSTYVFQGGKWLPECPSDFTAGVHGYPFLEVSSGSHTALGSTDGSTVAYRSVTERLPENGSTTFEYTTAIEFPDFSAKQPNNVSYLYKDTQLAIREDFKIIGRPAWPFIPQVNLDRKRGFLRRVTYRDEASKILQVKTNYPFMADEKLVHGVRVLTLRKDIDWMFSTYSYSSGFVGIARTTEETFDVVHGLKIASETTLEYKGNGHHFTTRESTRGSDGSTIDIQMRYPDDYTLITDPGHIISMMKKGKAHQVGAPVETKSFRDGIAIGGSISIPGKFNRANGEVFVAPDRTYKLRVGGLPAQSAWTLDPALPDPLLFVKEVDVDYDDKANLVLSTLGDQVPTCYLWQAGLENPIARVMNATAGNVFTTSFEEEGAVEVDADGKHIARTGRKTLQSGSFTFPFSFSPQGTMRMSYWYWQNNRWNFSGEIPYTSSFVSPGTKLDEVRAFPAGSQMTTYAYEQGVGMISSMDVNGITSWFEYDSLGRLSVVRDNDFNIVEAHRYHFSK